MRRNLDLTHGALFSQRVLLALVASGMERDEARGAVEDPRALADAVRGTCGSGTSRSALYKASASRT